MEEFNVNLFEKKLQTLKDSQESINTLSAWCLENRHHHKKIVTAWLNVLKRVKIEHRLTLFYLANDVIQYSKRKNYEFVESWGTTLQKATTMVREEKVKHRVLRIFKIWEQRGIYGEEFLSDLSGLISVAPVKKSEVEPLEFQASYLIAKINACSRLEEDTDLKLSKMKENEQKLEWNDPEAVVASLKDRQRVEDVEHEVDDGIRLVDAVMTALNAEIKARKHLLTLLSQADNFYREQRGEVKVVSNAYKNFGLRVKNLKKRLDEMLLDDSNWRSPIPSPDVNAPSPSPDSDLEVPGQEDSSFNNTSYNLEQSYSANFYTPVSDQSSGFTNNGFSSFMGSNISFDIHANLFNDSSTSHVSDTMPSNNLIEVVGTTSTPKPPPPTQNSFSLNNIIKQLLPNNAPVNSQHPIPEPYTGAQTPLLPPPMPPFSSPIAPYQPTNTSYPTQPYTYPNNTASYGQYSQTAEAPYHTEDYNPEEEIETWQDDGAWPEPPEMETPESPPGYEKEGLQEPVEYHDVVNSHGMITSIKDVDHRVLLPPPHLPQHLADIKGPDTDHRLKRPPKDIDHRNLISLTGSPRQEIRTTAISVPPVPPPVWGDQDYRKRQQDQDYRNEMNKRFLNLASDPPPPPPAPPGPIPSIAGFGGAKTYNKRPQVLRRNTIEVPTNSDNVESIDMELSDDDAKKDNQNFNNKRPYTDNLSVSNKRIAEDVVDGRGQDGLVAVSPESNYSMTLLESPPIPPSLEDDVDETANDILETINQDDFLEGLPDIESEKTERKWYNNEWNEKPHDTSQPPPNFPPAEFLQTDFQRPPPSLNPQFRPQFQPPPLLATPPTQQYGEYQDFNRGRGGGFQGSNRGFNRGWGKRGNNRGDFHNNRGDFHNNRGFSRGGRGGGGFRGRGRGGGGGGGGYRNQW